MGRQHILWHEAEVKNQQSPEFVVRLCGQCTYYAVPDSTP